MKTLRFVNPHKLTLLHEQLIAAGINPIRVEDDAQGAALITVDDVVSGDAVDAVVVAHNPAQPSAAELTDQERTQATTEMRDQYQAAVTRLNDIIDNGASYTATQTRDAVIDLARIMKRTLRLIRATV